MDSVIEKITLYDVLGYAIPGYIFLIIAGFGYVINMDTSILTAYADYAGYIMFIFLILGYVGGIIISEVSRGIVSLFELFRDWIKKFRANSVSAVDTELVASALKKSKFVKQDETITEISKKYYRIMYSDIQTDATYKRIHNYASAKMMYKNLVMSFLMGLLWNCFAFPECDYLNILRVLCLVVVILFGIRWYRFDEKTRNYTVLWFVKKYISSE